MEEARAVLDGLENARFSIDNNGRTTTQLSCTFHVDCAAVVRIKCNKDEQYVLSRSGMHTTEPAPVEEQRTGIHKPLLPEIDNLLLGGHGPKKCLNTLRMRYKESPEQLNLLPSTSQLKTRAHKLRKRGDFSITTYADVMEWASPRMCTTKEPFFQHMILGATDGTYKLHFGGWTLVSFGTFGVRYTASHKYQHKFYPMAFMFVRTETAFAYVRLFTFEALSDLVTENWAAMGEPEYAQWLDDEYLTDPWNLWFYAASGTPGVVPNQTQIESHHRAIKATAVDHLRAATGHVLAGTLPKILVECAMDIGSDRIRHHASGPVSAEVLGAAVQLCASANHYPNHQRKSQRAINRI
ncbi:hypothetical protein PHYSODRAFT_531753 [Phytophthora sojae]|uniref:MULE transposase domain-containing protein n=1 Tax=Phytophthora sojae (strain P6497) TaxID=1094619 RepID=G5AE81_PHYSP|nr:hypothetical protein PHYSODRAFT_531753 [Phytophthora sojae]EGZ06483.1 hypothetical protein PHYSODRAFT_531753 [Phytophthora sojae]|eukprot:XP_009538380.1 hypothetical protein PHYSODRAFT_531753 [Phytophthora sojae]